MQATAVIKACIRYLLALTLEPTQLLQLAKLFHNLMYKNAFKKTVQKAFAMPWKDAETIQVVTELCQLLIQEGMQQELRKFLHKTETRGAICELQVSAVKPTSHPSSQDLVLCFSLYNVQLVMNCKRSFISGS